MAEKISFVWDSNPAAEGVDYYQLFENGELVVDNITATNFDLLMAGKAEGRYDYQVGAVNEFGPGPLSEVVTVNFLLPSQVQGLAFTLV